MGVTYCDRSDLPTNQCAHCRGDDTRTGGPGRIGRTAVAVFDGTCPGCGDGIHPGDRIGLDLELGRFVCTGCTEMGTR